MKITADIIDDESFSILNTTSEIPQETNSQSRSNVFYRLNDNLGRNTTVAAENAFHQTQTVQEVTERLRDLNLSDPSSSTQYENFSSHLFASGSSKHPLIDLSNSEIMDPIKIEDLPPPWFQQWMAKMKTEIKKEILDELLNISSDFKQVQLSDTQGSKPGLVVKDENQLQYQGEVVHSGIYCDNCDQLIHGIRYKCGNCSDFDLCQECESLPNVHNKNHIFLKIRYPFALKLYQKQKWQELMSPLPIKPSRFTESGYSKSQSKKLYEAKFICDETVPDSTIIAPSTRFVKSWKVMNSGTRVWTHATKLHLIQGSADLIPISQKVDVPHLKPGEEGIVSVLFTSPPLAGVYRSHWNFCHKSRPFGHIVWCHIIVKEDGSISEQGISELPEKNMNKQVEVSNIAQVLTAVREEHEADNMVPRKLVVNSHTATPNNTPFALTPPKSPDHETATKPVCEINSGKTFLTQHDSDDDECSVVSISSSDSDTEFVVIPMPKCFNLSESFMSQHLRLPHNLMETAGNTTISSMEESKENSSLKNFIKKTTPVSQETGVPELAENTCEPLHSVVENIISNQKTTQNSHITTGGGSSSEISIIESENNSPTIENATQTLESVNMTLSTDISNSSEVESIEVHVTTVPSNVETLPTAPIGFTGIQEQANDIPCSATFPKFPVEGVTSDIYERPSSNVNTEERTIQVLPEGLVIGALSAAASVYNTAKAVISTIQHPKTENGECISQPLPAAPNVQRENRISSVSECMNPIEQLVEMGFCNRQLNDALLKKHKGDVALVVAELVSLSDNDWYASRHSPPSPPGFLD